MRKIVLASVSNILMVILPLLGKPELMIHYKIVVIILGSIAMWLTQPAFTVKETNGGHSNAGFSWRMVAKRVHFQDHRMGNDPVWGAGDTRQYMEYSVPPSIDYEENLKIQAKQRFVCLM